ncbi:MAG TPA: peptidylprolyl isomerase [Alphaproteobacteria bacterium]|nr:peptidylprolyl isomerase [Alphaproteobacteria bacterium]
MSMKAITTALIALCVAMPAQAAKSKAKDVTTDLVVATVDGDKITIGEVEAVRAANPQLESLPLESVYEALLDNMIDLDIVTAAARAAKVQDSDEFKKTMRDVEKSMLARFYLERLAKREQTKENLEALYAKYKKDNPPQEEMSAAHILLKTEKEALDVIKQLEKGADFAQLANEKSINKIEGGELGYFSREVMVPEFSEAAFAMKEGEISKKPVKTKFGYHVIKAGPRRLAEPPKYEEVEKELMQAQAAKTVEEAMTKMRKKAKIVKTPVKFENGKVVAK